MRDKIINYIFIVTSLLNSFILLKITCGFNLKFIITELIVIIFISSFSYLIKNKKVYFLIWSIILSLICVINSLYFEQFNDFLSICLIETLFQALRLPRQAITNVFEIKDFIFLYQIVLFLIILILDKEKYLKDRLSFKNSLIITFVLVLICCFNIDGEDIYRLNNEWNKVYKAKNFGIYTYQLTDIIYNFKNIINIKNDNIENNVLEFYSLKQYNTNQYTNIFKDKNVIFIHAESVQSMFINESINGNVITPNLNKLADTGIYFSNFYSEESVGSSSDTEYTFSTSMLPIGVGTTFLNYEDNTFSTLQHALSKEGYYTFSMHGNSCNYWNRDKMYKNIGYNHFYCYDVYDLDDKIGLGLSDKSFFDQSSDIINGIKDQKFAATLIMLTNHAPFNTEEKIDFDVSYMEGTLLGNYIKLVHYSDEAIGEFISKLDSLGILDNTIVVIYGDHDAKIKKSDYDRYYNYDIINNKMLDKTNPNYTNIDFYKYEEISRVPLIIWSKDSNINFEVSKVMGMIDLRPTISNMLGLDCKYCLGNDIFSVDENIVVFPNGNWVTDKVYYNNQYGEYKVLSGEVTDAYMNDFEQYAKKIVEISNDVLKYDLVK